MINLPDLEKELIEKLEAMSDEEFMAKMEACGVKFIDAEDDLCPPLPPISP